MAPHSSLVLQMVCMSVRGEQWTRAHHCVSVTTGIINITDLASEVLLATVDAFASSEPAPDLAAGEVGGVASLEWSDDNEYFAAAWGDGRIAVFLFDGRLGCCVDTGKPLR